MTLFHKPQFRGLFSFLLTLAIFWGGGQTALAQNATIEELIVTNSNTELLLFLTVNNAFTKQMEEGIKNGIPATFSFQVKLERKRSAWVNQELVSLKLDHTLSYDTLKEEYSLVRSELPGQTLRTKSLAEAKKAMIQINGLAVSPLKALLPEAGYLLRVKARLAEKTLPLYFHYVIPFWSLWNFETEWHTVEFRY
ncbi:MAG: hypothetical protein A2505_00615 [Deltaproteobacteria bacterium RIFOXYD12_FULL_55_16]|nr:MAG: hypothetical protein A2505_00615 [Deltaproteobacteria bacterium RIFOXYD12_FULL_55_16]